MFIVQCIMFNVNIVSLQIRIQITQLIGWKQFRLVDNIMGWISFLIYRALCVALQLSLRPLSGTVPNLSLQVTN